MSSVLNLVKQPDSYLSKSGFVLLKELGRGASGVVGLFERQGKQYAIKVVNIDQLVENEQMHAQMSGVKISREEAMMDIKKEVKNLKKIASKGPKQCGAYYNFILRYEAFVDPTLPFYYLISEPMSNDLFGFFLGSSGCQTTDCPESKIPGLSNDRDQLLLAIICQLFYALNCLHQIGLVHGDIKPENIFIDGTTGQIKIADFGGSGWMLPHGTPDTHDNQITDNTLIYAPPESFTDPTIIDPTIDTWALGLMILALSAKNPEVVFDNILAHKSQTDINKIIEEQVVMVNESNEQWVKELLRNLLQRDPARRSNTDQLLSDTRLVQQCKTPVGRILKNTVGPSALGGKGLDLSDISLKPLKLPSPTFSQRVSKVKRRLSPRKDARNGSNSKKADLRVSPLRAIVVVEE